MLEIVCVVVVDFSNNYIIEKKFNVYIVNFYMWILSILKNLN